MPTVALVDDHFQWLRFLSRELQRDGWTTFEFESGEEALAAEAAKFDTVVVDYLMPGVTGLDVARDLRAAGFSGPVILLSAYLDSAASATAAELGVMAVSKVDQLAFFRTMEQIRLQVQVSTS